MTPRYREFDRSRLVTAPLEQRDHDLRLDCVQALEPIRGTIPVPFHRVAEVLRRPQRGASILMMGAHVLRDGVQRYLIDLMERGFIDCIALNGAGVIHDYEFACIGATTESVARYIRDGRFGLWRETAHLNEIVSRGAAEGLGLGEAVGRAILDTKLPHGDISVVAAGYRLGIPITVHVGIGQDIVHEHPNCDGAAYGATSYRDFLRFAAVVEGLEDGVVMNFGSAVMAPEVYLKALAMARNVARQEARTIARFTALVCDLHDLPEEICAEPPRGTAAYYFRPWKTMLVRTVADGGKSFYLRGAHADTVPMLWSAIGKD